MSNYSPVAFAEHLLNTSKNIGFDLLEVELVQSRSFALRVANSSLCRETCDIENAEIIVSATWQGREAAFTDNSFNYSLVSSRIEKLFAQIKMQSPDAEFVETQKPKGQYTWNPCVGTLESLFPLEDIFATCEHNLQKVRTCGLRASGFIEAIQTVRHKFCSSNFTLQTQDAGLTIKFGVDNPQTLASGVGQSSVLGITQNSAHGKTFLHEAFANAMQEAIDTCQRTIEIIDPEIGNHTVILSPSAVAELLSTLIGYGSFNKRSIDEQRTYLSKKQQSLVFPPSLNLTLGEAVNLPHQNCYQPIPFNGHDVLCQSMNIIKNSDIHDLFLQPFWAKKCGLPQSLSLNNQTLQLYSNSTNTVNFDYATVEELIAATPRAIYVKDFWYLRMVSEMDGVFTGMTRDGVFEIVDGKIGRPLRNMRWHQNILELLTNITGITESRQLFGMAPLASSSLLMHMPAIRANNFCFSSTTKF